MKFMVFIMCFVAASCGIIKEKGSSSKEDKTSRVTFLPENNLHLYDNSQKSSNANGIDEAYFNAIIEKAQAIYGPIVAKHGGNLVIAGDWGDSTVNAYADRDGDGSTWRVQMFGGMARRDEITKDGFALVICHELGHHLGGFPQYAGQWASNEGNSDFYATAGCAEKLFTDEEPEPQPEPNPKAPCPFIPEANGTPCKVFTLSSKGTVCKRSMDGALSLGRLLAALGGERAPSFDTPDKSRVNKTSDSHPKAQCRLDTMYAGILCEKKWNDSIIPANKAEMAQVSCPKRPACWYKP